MKNNSIINGTFIKVMLLKCQATIYQTTFRISKKQCTKQNKKINMYLASKSQNFLYGVYLLEVLFVASSDTNMQPARVVGGK